MKMLFIRAIRPQSVGWFFLVWLLMGSQWTLAQGNPPPVPPPPPRWLNPDIIDLCLNQKGQITYTGQAFQIRPGEACPKGRQLTLYVVPQGEPLTSGIVVGSVTEVVSCRTVYPPGNKNYKASTELLYPMGRINFSIPATLPANLLNRPVELRFGEPKPRSIQTVMEDPYIINPANCP